MVALWNSNGWLGLWFSFLAARLVIPKLSRSVWLSVLCQSTDMLGVVVAVREDCNLLFGSEVWGIVQGAYAQYALAPCSLKALKPFPCRGKVGTIPIVGGTCRKYALWNVKTPGLRDGWPG